MTDPAAPPVWLITGCSSGFGRELVEVALARGARAVATARDPSRLDALLVGHADRSLALALDVTDPDQVAGAVRSAVERFGRIDVLVNNAGRGFAGAVEEASDDEVRATFELNVFGLLAMTRAVLPTMRAQRSGAIVNITSVGGLLARAGTGIYAASKFAVEGMTQSLAAEVRPLGIKVMAVEPGPFRTNFASAMDRAAARIDDYAATAHARIDEVVAGGGKQVGDPRRAAEAIASALEAAETPTRLVLGAPALRLVRASLEQFTRDLDAWASVSVGADFPAGEGR
jgi:NAD(P)-dependent dehydrogenase (short-subunit alcohol dehydrogenase family)